MSLLHGARDALISIPVEQWGEAFADSRELDFETWSALYLPGCPAHTDPATYDIQARAIYKHGPLLYYQATHVN